MKEIIIYQTPDKKTEVEVRVDEESVWLTQQQIADLFNQTKQNISLHINNMYKERELKRSSTVKESLTVQIEGKRQISRMLDYYNLDVVISVGYRVKSKRGIQFRVWATNVLRRYLIDGFALNEKKLKETERKYRDLQEAVKLVAKVSIGKQLDTNENQGILKILAEFSRALDLLDKYDHQQLQIPLTGTPALFALTYKEAKKQIEIWCKAQNAGKLFGNEKDDSFKGSLENIYQTFDGLDLYPSLEEKAAHLLYFIVKNHSFTDGNKRIGAGLFAYFLDMNQRLFTKEGIKIIDDNTLVALTLLIAESRPDEKEIMVKVIVNLINA